jgi:hypothetical protein
MYRFLVSLVLCIGFAVPARADLIYSLSFDSSGTSLGTSVSLTQGTSQTFNVFFHEVFTTPNVPLLDLAGGVNGLTTANFRVNRGGVGGSAISGVAGNALFDANTPTFTPTLATVEQEVIVNGPVFGTGSLVAPGVRSVQIGSITVTASGGVGDLNTFLLADFNPGVGVNDVIIDNGVGGLAFSPDSVLNFGTLSVTVSAVPEPSSLVLVGLLGVCAVGYFLRSRRLTTLKASLAHTQCTS